MDADLDLLLIAVYCTVDDLLPKRPGNARRRITDAEVVTLSIAQAVMGIPSDPRFLAVAAKRLAHLFPSLPERTAFHKRRLRLSGVIEGLISEFARHSPGFYDELLLVDSTPVECARSRETVKRGEGNLVAITLTASDANFSQISVALLGGCGVSAAIVDTGGTPLSKTYNGNIADAGYPVPTTFLWDPWAAKVNPCCYILDVRIYDRVIAGNHWSGGHSNENWQSITIA